MGNPVEQESVYKILHRDSTITFLGASRLRPRITSLIKLAMPTTESEIDHRLAEAKLPFQTKVGPILGWGGFSVATRFTNPHHRRFAAVLRSSTDLDYPRIVEKWKKEKAANDAFTPYAIKQSLILSDGIDHKPTPVKISPEVDGATFSELSVFYLARVPRLLDQYLDITIRNLKYFLSHGEMVELFGGHIFQNPIARYLDRLAVFPFNVSNLMVDFQTNNVLLVDSEPQSIKDSHPRLKAQLGLRILGLGANVVLLNILRGINYLRNKLFSIPTQEKEVKKMAGYDQFIAGFAEVINDLNQSGVDYRVLGSFAIAASLQGAGEDYFLAPKRSNDTIRDIDVKILSGDPEIIKGLETKFRFKKIKVPFYPEVSLGIPISQEGLPTIFPITITSISVDQNGHHYLVFKENQKQIPGKYLDPVVVSYDGIQFPTVSSDVLAGFALTRFGALKAKDVDKVTRMLGANRVQIPLEFLDWAKKLRQSFPDHYRNAMIRDAIYHFTGGHLANGQLSKIVSFFITRKIPLMERENIQEVVKNRT